MVKFNVIIAYKKKSEEYLALEARMGKMMTEAERYEAYRKMDETEKQAKSEFEEAFRTAYNSTLGAIVMEKRTESWLLDEYKKILGANGFRVAVVKEVDAVDSEHAEQEALWLSPPIREFHQTRVIPSFNSVEDPLPTNECSTCIRIAKALQSEGYGTPQPNWNDLLGVALLLLIPASLAILYLTAPKS